MSSVTAATAMIYDIPLLDTFRSSSRTQDKQYLANAVARLAVVKPDVVLVERSVARMAQEDLLVGVGCGEVRAREAPRA